MGRADISRIEKTCRQALASGGPHAWATLAAADVIDVISDGAVMADALARIAMGTAGREAAGLRPDVTYAEGLSRHDDELARRALGKVGVMTTDRGGG